jgi:hypothetical protein
MAIMDLTINAVLAAVNSANAGLALTLPEVQFSAPRVNDATWQGETLSGNTLIRVTPNETSKYTGTTVIGYDRLNLSVLQTLLGGVMRLPDTVTTVAAAVPYFDALYSLTIVPSDFVDGPITVNADSTRTLTLTAVEGAIAWIGTASFSIKAAPVSVNNVITNTVLDGYQYLHDTTKGFAESYSFPMDFTPEFATMSTITQQTTNFATLAASLTAISGDTWVTSGTAGFSLDGAVVLNAGINQAEWPTNHNYKYAVIIQLGTTSTNLEGSLILHFNDPVETFDPNVV